MRVVLVAVTMVAMVAACSSSTRTIDASTLEDEIQTFLEKSNRVNAISCPDDVEVRKGGDFTCSARIEGRRRVIDVQQRDGDGSVTFAVRSAS